MTMRCLNFFQQADSKEERIDSKESDLIKILPIVQKVMY